MRASAPFHVGHVASVAEIALAALVVLAAVPAVTWPRPAWAQPASVVAVPRGQVAVLRPDDIDQLTRAALARVTGELTAARFQVTVFPLDPHQDPTLQVENIAPDLRPVAAFAIARAPRPTDEPDTIAIWVCDRLGRRTTIQRMTMAGTNISQDAEVLALEAIELIRVSIAGLWPPHAHTSLKEPDSALLPPPLTLSQRRRPELSIGLGIAAAQDRALTSADWMPAFMASLLWPRGPTLRLQIRGLGPGVSLRGDYGSANLQRQTATMGVGWAFWVAERVRSLVVVAAGVERLSISSAADDPTRIDSPSAWSGVVSAGVAASARLGGVFALGIHLDGIMAWPATTVRVGQAVTRRLSFPGVVVTADLQARF